MQTFEHEPVPGLPEALPEGERILWQGSPRVGALAVRAFHARKVGIYLGLLVVARGLFAAADGATAPEAILAAAQVLPIAVLGVGILVGLAWAHARTTLYTITNRRVVLRYGVALQMMVNLPFTAIVSASFRTFRDGTGDLPLVVRGDVGPSYLHLWPHARPWRMARPEPALRALPDAASVARTLAEALLVHRSGEEADAAAEPPGPSPRPPSDGRVRVVTANPLETVQS